MKLSKKIIALLFIAALAACGQTPTDASDVKIVGGSRVSTSDVIVKSTVALVSPDGNQFCTGSLISPRHVLTASHCLDDLPWSTVRVAFGTVAKPGYFATGRLRTARYKKMHESYDREQMDADEASSPPNDIALLTLESDAPSGYTPVRVLGPSDALFEHETLTLAGFGVTRYDADTSGILYKVTSYLTKQDRVAKEIHFGDRRGHTACMGDSGGPAFVNRDGRLVLVGVTSRGSSVCDEEGIYTDARQFSRWIEAAKAEH